MSDERYERSARLGERENISPLLGFFRRIESLKQLVRTGWVFRKIPEAKAESVADHKWSTMMMADTLTAKYAPHLDRGKVVRMLMVHELGEIEDGDVRNPTITDAAARHRNERAGVIKVLGDLHNREEYLALWDEFEAKQTPEAQWARQIDRLEFYMQFSAYHERGYIPAEVLKGKGAITDPNLVSFLNEVLAAHDRELAAPGI